MELSVSLTSSSREALGIKLLQVSITATLDEPLDTMRISYGIIFLTPEVEANMNEQDKVTSFIQEHEMESPPTYRLLDVVSELGEVAKDAAESTDYGSSPEEVDIASDEVGDVLFSLLALAEAAEIDAGEAVEEAMDKYDERITDSGTPSSGN